MEQFEALASNLIKDTYVKQGLQSLQTRQKLINQLLSSKKIPNKGWEESLIEYTIQELSAMDSNNFLSNCGVGEREGRVFSSLVKRRHFGLAHGIGRSGDIAEQQPKAAGSSLLYKMTTSMALHALQLSGMKAASRCLLIPMATGMTLSLCMLTMKNDNPTAKFVIWSRIDQKSCFKSILSAGLTPLIVDCKLHDGQLVTDVEQIHSLLESHPGEILCVLSTTSCFAPRQPDLVDEIAKLCKEFNVGHIINNAYGLQCPYISKLISRACVIGRVDLIVQSTDKNFMVPVGGAVIASPSADLIDRVAKMYPGRASMSPILDLFITLLSMGETGLLSLWEERQRLFATLTEGLHATVTQHEEHIISSPQNSISIAVSLDSLNEATERAGSLSPSFMGSMLFQRNVSGCRVVAKSSKETQIAGHTFIGWGSHTTDYPHSYFTVACAVGATRDDIASFSERLEKVWKKIEKTSRQSKRNNTHKAAAEAEEIANSADKKCEGELADT